MRLFTAPAGMGGQEVLRRVEAGYRMPPPPSFECPDSLYDMILKCWDQNAMNRPTFSFLYDFAKLGDAEAFFMLRVDAIAHMTHFFLAHKTHDSFVSIV